MTMQRIWFLSEANNFWGGLLPGHAASNNAATAHPNANEPNIDSLARRYLGEWCNKISTVHQHAPSGMVRSVECANICLADVINLLAEDVTLQTKCFVCGGIGHAASCTLADGTVLTPMFGPFPEACH